MGTGRTSSTATGSCWPGCRWPRQPAVAADRDTTCTALGWARAAQRQSAQAEACPQLGEGAGGLFRRGVAGGVVTLALDLAVPGVSQRALVPAHPTNAAAAVVPVSPGGSPPRRR